MLISIIDIDIDKLIQHCDTTQLNELILLASKKLDRIENMKNYEIVTTKELSQKGIKVFSVAS